MNLLLDWTYPALKKQKNGYMLMTGDKRKTVEHHELLGGRYVPVDTLMMVQTIDEADEEK